MQSRGQWGARHFDKVMFNLPIPLFDPSEHLHNELAAAAAEAERIAAGFELPENVKFQRARKLIRDALTESGIAPHIDELQKPWGRGPETALASLARRPPRRELERHSPLQR